MSLEYNPISVPSCPNNALAEVCFEAYYRASDLQANARVRKNWIVPTAGDQWFCVSTVLAGYLYIKRERAAYVDTLVSPFSS